MNCEHVRISYWFPLVKSLTKYLTEYTIDEVDENGNPIYLFDGIDIYAGTKGKDREYPCIEISWEAETDISVNLPCHGSVTIWIDTCVENDRDTPSQAYENQYDLQNKILSVLRGWAPKGRDDTGAAPNVTIEGIVSDGDIYYPVSVSRIILTVDWRR